MIQPPETEAQGRKRIRETDDERESKTQKLSHESQSDSLSGLRTFLHHVPAPLGDDIVPTTCSEAVGHQDKPCASILASPCLGQGSVCREAGGSKGQAIYIPSDSESEPDGEADDNAPSFRKRNTLIHKGPTRQHYSPSPAPTISTVLNTPCAMSSGLERDGDFEDVQHSHSPSPVTSVSARPRPQQRGRAEPPQQTEPHESASRNAIRIPHGEDSYQSRPIMTKTRAKLVNECKSTAQLVGLFISIVEELGSDIIERLDALRDEMVDRFDDLKDGMVDQDQDDN
ncbi:hypothetical protein BBAD15_g11879 [Beauveria bassiana D1-5]|uniref:Uncharacterized protein n=1 Tax=Beauveria bassiana D1-5 TaxID=1245745 RepID=A0A0A2V509_BEABA|nr:hypothetical protein BBAD15_g11879 [Beauveria bassiana D1-5]